MPRTSSGFNPMDKVRANSDSGMQSRSRQISQEIARASRTRQNQLGQHHMRSGQMRRQRNNAVRDKQNGRGARRPQFPFQPPPGHDVGTEPHRLGSTTGSRVSKTDVGKQLEKHYYAEKAARDGQYDMNRFSLLAGEDEIDPLDIFDTFYIEPKEKLSFDQVRVFRNALLHKYQFEQPEVPQQLLNHVRNKKLQTQVQLYTYQYKCTTQYNSFQTCLQQTNNNLDLCEPSLTALAQCKTILDTGNIPLFTTTNQSSSTTLPYSTPLPITPTTPLYSSNNNNTNTNHNVNIKPHPLGLTTQLLRYKLIRQNNNNTNIHQHHLQQQHHQQQQDQSQYIPTSLPHQPQVTNLPQPELNSINTIPLTQTPFIPPTPPKTLSNRFIDMLDKYPLFKR